MGKAIDLSGQVFERLTAIELTGGTKDGKRMWRCMCQCGQEKTVAGTHLRYGLVRSCGCLRREVNAARGRANVRHGHARTTANGRLSPEYRSWSAMKARCFKPSHPAYARYGAAGITVCERWLTFENFLADMGDRAPGMSLERADNAKGYEPGNVVWADRKTQERNKSSSRWVTVDGETRTLAEWCERYGVSYPVTQQRLDHGWDPKRALTEPLHREKSHAGTRRRAA